MYEFEEERPEYPQFVDELLADPLVDFSVCVNVKRGAERLSLFPYKSMARSNAPKWWSAHNKVKHDRRVNFAEGNLDNAINSLAALYYIELVFAKHIGDHWYKKLPYDNPDTRDVPNDKSRLFSVDSFSTRCHLAGYDSYFLTNDEVEELANSIFQANKR